MQCILNIDFKYLYFKYFTTASVWQVAMIWPKS